MRSSSSAITVKESTITRTAPVELVQTYLAKIKEHEYGSVAVKNGF